MIEGGVSHVPEDRLGMGLVGNLSITDNTILKDYRQAPLAGPSSAGPAISACAT